jgi:2-dehydro-3-deoxyphosphogluconate aldolase / (4S)-4-hydroxy-2-oxoglutarate aldolase
MRAAADPGGLGGLLDAVPVIGIVRTATQQAAVAAAQGLLDRGVRAVEVSLTTPDGLSAIRMLRRERPEGTAIGVGTVRSVTELEASVEAGAEFIVTPTVVPAVVHAAVRAGLPSVIGASTPTEIQLAVESGANYVKVFPASQWSIGSFRDIRAVFGEIPFVPTGGVRLEDAAEWIAAGAAAVGLGSALTREDVDVGALLRAIAAARRTESDA